MKKLPFDDCITTQQAADILSVSTVRVTEFCTEGRLEGTFKFGPVWAIPKKSVAKFAKIDRPLSGHVGNPFGRPPEKS